MVIDYQVERKLVASSKALYVTVPKLWQLANNLTKDSKVIVTVMQDRIIIRPVKKK